MASYRISRSMARKPELHRKLLPVIFSERDRVDYCTTLNPQGDPLISLAATTVDGKGLISVSDEKGRKLLWLGATVDGEGLIASFDHYGAVKARWP